GGRLPGPSTLHRDARRGPWSAEDEDVRWDLGFRSLRDRIEQHAQVHLARPQADRPDGPEETIARRSLDPLARQQPLVDPQPGFQAVHGRLTFRHASPAFELSLLRGLAQTLHVHAEPATLVKIDDQSPSHGFE